MKKDEALAEQHARQRVINRTEDDLRQLQGRLTRITAETEAARGRIQQIKAEVAEARAAIPNVNHLKQGKQSLLAKQALGQDVTGELQEKGEVPFGVPSLLEAVYQPGDGSLTHMAVPQDVVALWRAQSSDHT